jgi:hypothetical protein
MALAPWARQRASAVLLPAVLSLLAPYTATAQEPTLDAVLTRAAAYVTDFQRRLSGIVAEESYLQQINSGAGGPLQRVRLMSDVLLVRPPGAEHYVQFRDVFAVNGASVRDREERLTRLFLDPSASAVAQIDRIAMESARHNIGDIQRNTNFPILPMVFLDPRFQPRFRFARTRNRVPTTAIGVRPGTDPSLPRLAVPREVWVIEYREVEPKTVIRTTAGRDLPARGRLWVEPNSGRVLMTELVAEDANVRGVVEVSYGFEPAFGLLVPVAMRDRYEHVSGATRVDGYATYSRFRRFDVKTSEQIAPPPFP